MFRGNQQSQKSAFKRLLNIANLLSRQMKKTGRGEKGTNNHVMVENVTPLKIFMERIKKIIKGFYKQLYTHRFLKLDKIHEFFKTQNFIKLI